MLLGLNNLSAHCWSSVRYVRLLLIKCRSVIVLYFNLFFYYDRRSWRHRSHVLCIFFQLISMRQVWTESQTSQFVGAVKASVSLRLVFHLVMPLCTLSLIKGLQRFTFVFRSYDVRNISWPNLAHSVSVFKKIYQKTTILIICRCDATFYVKLFLSLPTTTFVFVFRIPTRCCGSPSMRCTVKAAQDNPEQKLMVEFFLHLSDFSEGRGITWRNDKLTSSLWYVTRITHWRRMKRKKKRVMLLRSSNRTADDSDACHVECRWLRFQRSLVPDGRDAAFSPLIFTKFHERFVDAVNL